MPLLRTATELVVPGGAAAAGFLTAATSKIADYLALAKARLSTMVVVSAMLGFWLAGGSAGPELAPLISFAIGSFLVIGGANALNQVAERRQDALMQRTAQRPLPAGRVSVAEALIVATVMSAVGLGTLLVATNWLTTALAASALLIYVFLYTPLKRRSGWATFVGAVSGAIPPVMGWTAVRNDLGAPAWILFGILFCWQFPHTWAIALAYGEDYARAGYRMLPAQSLRDESARGIVLLFTALLLPISLAPAALGFAGSVYLAGALGLGVGLAAFTLRLGRSKTKEHAVQLMAVSLIYLPLILTILVLDRRSL